MTESEAVADAVAEAVAEARRLFLDEANGYGCAETTFTVLVGAFGLPDRSDSSVAMAMNGGVAYSGGTCGALTGAAMALGLLANGRIADRPVAKRTARRIAARLIDAFEEEHGSSSCRELIGTDLRTDEQHRAFIESGAWREGCMRQVEFAVRRLAPLADEASWDRILRELDEPRP